MEVRQAPKGVKAVSASHRVHINGQHRDNYINGGWRPAENQPTRRNVNPADLSDELGDFVESGGADADRAMEAAVHAQTVWFELVPVKRAQYLTAASRLRKERAEYIVHASPGNRASCWARLNGDTDRQALSNHSPTAALVVNLFIMRVCRPASCPRPVPA
ncbi:aldehyde dehydrogenase family protein [Streptomyces sp. NPDC020800]|uniref:aldehyde dehydrogenase family protein n=1 Tax=Streptomyces sp. NPDC020800 TaxID=3365092 RepID=UPI003798D884